MNKAKKRLFWLLLSIVILLKILIIVRAKFVIFYITFLPLITITAISFIRGATGSGNDSDGDGK